MQNEELEALAYHALEVTNVASPDGDPLYFILKSNGEYFVRGTFLSIAWHQ
jgi:hypothetical protein